jgi:hypothetical protein
MILVDTSIWIDHFRVGDASLALMLDAGDVLIHPFVIGEIALGNLPNRGRVLGDLQGLPHVDIATHKEVLRFVSDKMLFGLGIGLIDVHLLASTFLTIGTKLWTRDKKLSAAAARMNVALEP